MTNTFNTITRPPAGVRRFRVAGARALAVVVVLAMVAACAQEAQVNAVCALLIDRTVSSDIDGIGEDFQEYGRQAIEGCADRQSVLLVYSFASSGPRVERATDEPITLYQPGGMSRRDAEEAVATAREEALTTVSSTLDAEVEDGGRASDVLSALRIVADNVMEVQRRLETPEARIIVLTDGIQISNEVTVADLAGDVDADRLVSGLPQDSIPDLSGIS
ncbi:MAG TPA: hypothetical protein VMM13_13230, partial [Euzebya sp.]|nr:hypothetical protein [Euzebya sp.]